MKEDNCRPLRDVEITGFWFTLLFVWPAVVASRVHEWVFGR